ncbi:hypothetical protein [Haloferula rosea]|uniref:Uncharacterized protein n=1 Tax=Haloferula rosea TaxID=490093 RepID=A0A934VHG1_9BACT|nr:hypothetical protein [Haloferula rosea]MBK1829037.1 hypothetical protein [Haloferula rosea]
MTADEVAESTSKLAGRYEEHWRDDQKIRHFSQQLRPVPDAAVFDGLFRYFRQSGHGDPGMLRQEVAGSLLFFRAPEPTIPLDQILLECMETYNLSIEQLPWYLSRHFGRDRFRVEVDTLLSSTSLSERSTKSLETLLYWIRVPEEQIREVLVRVAPTEE